ncbi:MAG: hypothetical protein B7X98_00975 [Methylophilaceae bacterium 17-43-7]|nr:MAG: hypothetical protein B7Y48_10540 [Methylophilales bacterium 28-44-11]OYZ70027.1 MAG: hypothetical protein B7X98_00975 [Methylophilaceae bacterium 17-43-7]
MKITKKSLVGLIGVFALLIVLPFLIPTASYVAQFERQASEVLGMPVDIADAHIYFLPTPRLTIEDVKVGKSQEVKIASMEIIPRMLTLFSEPRSIEVNINQPVIKDSALPLIAHLMGSTSNNKARLSVELTQIQVKELELQWSTLKLPMLNIQANFTQGMQFLSAEISSDNGQIQANIQPVELGQSIVLKMQAWVMPLSNPLLVDQGRVEMVLYNNRLDVSQFALQMYGGTINGNAKLDWRKLWHLNGQLFVKNMSLLAPTKSMSSRMYLGGSLEGNGRFSANAKNAQQLINQLNTECSFSVNNGVLYGLDLVKLASLLVKQTVKGGQTQFDTLTGQLAISGKRYHLKRMVVSSGLITAKGNVRINEQKKLDGTGEVALKQSAGLVSVPLSISGTLSNPQIYPSKAALAGAAVGTAILGPGLGTSLGSKAGSAISGMKDWFGGSD